MYCAQVMRTALEKLTGRILPCSTQKQKNDIVTSSPSSAVQAVKEKQSVSSHENSQRHVPEV